ncbi:MAG: DUF177 domain-containing protein [Chitinophagaceae bacterium]|nr:MAG: DUF177 domain-containing protein [Chitinophagaceae bacterium]
MGHRREFEIPFVGLKPGIHEYSYQVTDRFFESFGPQDFTGVNAQVKVSLDRKSSFMMLKFEIGGNLVVSCDRCGNDLPLDLWDEFRVTVKMVEEPELMNDQEEDPDVYYIGRNESHIDVAAWIYEFVNLSIPMQKTCAPGSSGGDGCNPAAMDILKKMEVKDQEPSSNPIWKDLEKFRDLEKE